MLYEHFFLGVSWTLAVMVLWFNTNFVVSYAELLGFRHRWLEQYKLSTFAFSFGYYLANLAETCNSKLAAFAMKLLSCPKCLSLWVSIIICVLTNNYVLVAPIWIASVFLFDRLTPYQRAVDTDSHQQEP